MYSTEETKEKLKELLKLKRNGEVNTEELLKMDYSLPSITIHALENYIYHRDEEVKITTLALVVESKKSTLKFTPKELEIVALFLRENFKEKIEYVPFIKKVLKRMKDSLAVMKRQYKLEEKMRNHYRNTCDPLEIKSEILEESSRLSKSLQIDINNYLDYFQTLRNMCVCNADATYYKRKCSLEILLLMRDLLNEEIDSIPWKTEQVKALFDLMILDGYESNKKMAFDLIKSVDLNLLGLNDKEAVHDIIQVAIELGNSVRPIDTTTAAYMLKIGLLSPIVLSVIDTQLGSIKIVEDAIEAPALNLILVLLNKLKESLALAKKNIVRTVAKHSLYGYLFCIRSLLQDCNLKSMEGDRLWQNTVAELVAVCFEFSCAVSMIVSSSSPEGHLPMDLSVRTANDIDTSEPEMQLVTSQMVLLCSWRTIKEISLLFGLLATKAPINLDNSNMGLLNEDQLIKIGRHLFSLLIETKHRGAFEQAHVGFSQLCSRLWRLKKTSLNRLPKVWLHQILITITGIKENSKLCATRRSAGVPFMIQALLSTEPRQNKDATGTFHSVMKILLALAQLEGVDLWKKTTQLIQSNPVFAEFESSLQSEEEDEEEEVSLTERNISLTEIKTHSLNILRAIFRHSQLGEMVNNYVEDGVISALRSYDAPTWAERNAATLLFSALIIRIFGVQRTKDHINLSVDNKMHYGVFFKKYPKLLPFVLDELLTLVAMNDTLMKPNVQSILLLLSRLYHSQITEVNTVQPTLMISDLIDLIIQCSESAVFETRQLAARALVPFLSEESVERILTGIIENTLSAQNRFSLFNSTHGHMLQIFEIIKHFGNKLFKSCNVNWNLFLKENIWILENLENTNKRPPCFLVAAIFIDICIEIFKLDKTYLPQILPILYKLVSHLLHDKLKQGAAKELYKLSAIKFIETATKETSIIRAHILINICLYNLRVYEMETFLWPTITEIMKQTNYDETSMALLDYSLKEIQNLAQHFYKYSPELQDTIFDFLYNNLLYLDEHESSDSKRKMNICRFVLNELQQSNKKHYYCERDCYLRLLGKSYVTFTNSNKENDVRNFNNTNEVYNSLCDYMWISSLSGNFRTSVFQIMQDLFLICCKHVELQYEQIQWWTTVLKLLMDNNSEIRYQAFLLLDNIPISVPVTNKWPSISLLLSKFHECNVQNNWPELTCVVLFYWSNALEEDIDYEMDDTDVFNKCTNYDFYEPVELSRICVDFLIKNMHEHLDNILQDETIDWINSVLNTEFKKSTSFKTLIKQYECYIPALNNNLRDILNPTYKNKLLRILAYKPYKETF